MKRAHYIILLALILFSCEKPISEFQSKNFIKYFGSGYESKGNDVIELSDGGYLFVGYDLLNNTDYQVYACKVNEDGNEVWSNSFGDGNTADEGKVVKEVSDGFIIAGTSVESSGLIHSFIMKVNQHGNIRWKKNVGKSTYDITVNDMLVEGSSIYLAGNSDTLAANKTDYYISKLDTSGNKVWDKHFHISLNSSFQRIFSNNENLILVGNDGSVGKPSIFVIPKNYFSISSPAVVGNANETVIDSYYSGTQLFILLNNGTASMALENVNSELAQVWRTNAISNIMGKSVIANNDGSLIVCGENSEGGNSFINFIKVDKDGGAQYGSDIFRTFQGSVGKILRTNDDGLILVGTTGSTFGKNIQLIKTDRDYFMLKN